MIRIVNRAAETKRKRAERQRRREAGEVRIEAWIDSDVRNRLVAGCRRSGVTVARGIEMMVNDTWPAPTKANQGPIKMVNAYDTGHRYK